MCLCAFYAWEEGVRIHPVDTKKKSLAYDPKLPREPAGPRAPLPLRACAAVHDLLFFWHLAVVRIVHSLQGPHDFCRWPW
jgi:hypothetical protein